MRSRLVVLVAVAGVSALSLTGCGPACDSFEAGFVSNPQGEATPRAAVDAWLTEVDGGARDRDPGSWHETADPLAFSNGDRIVKVADFTAVPGASGYLVQSCQ